MGVEAERMAAAVEPPAEEGELGTQEELVAAIVAELREHPGKRDELLAEIYVEAAAARTAAEDHRSMLETIAGTLDELLRDPKRIVSAFFGSRRRGRRGKHEPSEEEAIGELLVGEEEEGKSP